MLDKTADATLPLEVGTSCANSKPKPRKGAQVAHSPDTLIANGGGATVPLSEILEPGRAVTLVRNDGGEILAVPESELRRFDRPEPRSNLEPEFDWLDDDAVVLREQRSTAIYRNRSGGLVIRQERAWDEEEDVFIVITPENEQAFIDRLTEVAGIPSVGGR